MKILTAIIANNKSSLILERLALSKFREGSEF